MKRIWSLCFILLLTIVIAFCATACGSNPNENGGEDDPSDTDGFYVIAVNTKNCSVDTNDITVCIYTLDGTLLGEKKLSKGKSIFEIEADDYIATLSGLSEEVSYSSVLLTKTNKKATIVLEKVKYNEYSEFNIFTFTVIVMAGNRNLDDLTVQICDDNACLFVKFEDGNVADLLLNCGKYEVKVYGPSAAGFDELYNEDYTVTSDKRFCVIVL